MKKTFVLNKLIRDKILPLMVEEGVEVKELKMERPNQRLDFFKAKIVEEALEVQDASSNEETTEEIADLLEIIYAYCHKLGISMEEVEDVRLRKKSQKGGFDACAVIDTITISPDSDILTKFYDYYLKNKDKYPEYTND